MIHGIILNGYDKFKDTLFRPAGAYRIREACRQAGYQVEVLEFFPFWEEEALLTYLDRVVSRETLFIGISTTFIKFTEALGGFVDRLKLRYPDVKLILGGTKTDVAFVTQSLDYRLLGYADAAIVALLDFLSGRSDQLITRDDGRGGLLLDSSNYPADMTNIPIRFLPEDHLTPLEVLPMEISRGCIFKCKFCSFPMTGKKKFDYIRDEVSIREEFIYNHDQFGITEYVFMDDTYNDSLHKLEMMHRAIMSLPFTIRYSTYLRIDLISRYPEMIPLLVETGLRTAAIGIESFHQPTRTIIGKGMVIEEILETIRALKRANPQLVFHSGFIVGLPEESMESITKTAEWLITENNGLIDQWEFLPYGMETEATVYRSPIDKNPELFGYTVLGHRDWINQYMSYSEAKRMAKQLNKLSAPYQRVAGFPLPSVLALGYSEDYLRETPLGDIPWDAVKVRLTDRIRDYQNKKFANLMR